MKQFDIFKNLNNDTNSEIPYFLIVQHDILSHVTSCVIVPLVTDIQPSTHLNPIFEIENQKVIMSTTEIASVPRNILSQKVCSLEHERVQILNAIDFMITGF
jgi:toxin CcdB